jgi:hypothetical protein
MSDDKPLPERMSGTERVACSICLSDDDVR